MNRQLHINEVRRFLAVASRQFEQGNIFLHSVRFVRDETTGEEVDIILSYEQKGDDAEKEKQS